MESKSIRDNIKKYINKINIGDCVHYLEKIPDNSIDVCFADPPFNLKKKYGKYSDSLKEADYLNWCERWLLQLIRIIKPSGSIFIHNVPYWLTHYASILNKQTDIKFKKWIAWDAISGANGKNLHPSHYGILYYIKNEEKLKFNKIRHPHKRERTTTFLLKDWGGKKDHLHPFGPLVSDVWTDIHRVKHNKFKDDHPCQLPIHLLQRLILMSTDAGDLILDPFMGTGTTAIAAKSLGRNYIGFELDEDYVLIAKNKIVDTKSNSKIDKNWVSIFNNEIVTIRDKDWPELKNYYIIPDDIKEINNKKIKLKKAISQLTFNFLK